MPEPPHLLERLRDRRARVARREEQQPADDEGREPRRWGGTIGVVLVVVLISALLKTFVVQTFTIPSPSLETTLMTGDRVAVSVWDAGDVWEVCEVCEV